MPMDKAHCRGCRNDFYNGRENFGGSDCWSLPDARVVTRYTIHLDAPNSGYKSAWRKVQRPQCFTESRTVHIGPTEYSKLRGDKP